MCLSTSARTNRRLAGAVFPDKKVNAVYSGKRFVLWYSAHHSLEKYFYAQIKDSTETRVNPSRPNSKTSHVSQVSSEDRGGLRLVGQYI